MSWALELLRRRSVRIFLLLAVGAAAMIYITRQRSGPQPGQLAADFTLPVVAGGSGELTFSAFRGRPVLVEVFASGSSSSQKAAPLVAASARAPRRGDVAFLGVSVDDRADEARAAAHRWALPFPVVHDDGRVVRSWKVSRVPTFVLVDAEGKVRAVGNGAPAERTIEYWLTLVGAGRL